jgi:hypothetical protein
MNVIGGQAVRRRFDLQLYEFPRQPIFDGSVDSLVKRVMIRRSQKGSGRR